MDGDLDSAKTREVEPEELGRTEKKRTEHTTYKATSASQCEAAKTRATKAPRPQRSSKEGWLVVRL